MNRLEKNKELLSILEILINKYPEQRFNQILYNYGFTKHNVDYYNEPEETLLKVNELKNHWNKGLSNESLKK